MTGYLISGGPGWGLRDGTSFSTREGESDNNGLLGQNHLALMMTRCVFHPPCFDRNQVSYQRGVSIAL